MPRKIITIFLIVLLSGGLIYGGNKFIKNFLSQPDKYTEELTQEIKEKKVSSAIQTPEILGEKIEKRLQELQAGRVWQKTFSVLSPVNQNWSVMIGQIDSAPKFKLQIQGSVGPFDNNQFDLGSPENQWASVYSQNIFQNGQQVVSNANASGGIIASISGNTLNLSANFAEGGCVGVDSKGNIKTLDNCLDFDKFKDKMSLNTDTDIHLNDADLTLSVGRSVIHKFSPEGDVFFDKPDSTFFVNSQNNRVGIGTLSPFYPLDVEGDIRSKGQIIASKLSDFDDNSFYLNPDSTSRVNSLIILNALTADQILSSGRILYLNNSVLTIDKSSKRVGVNTLSPVYDLDVSGQAYFSSRTIAPLFADADDLSYFIDPASNSYLNIAAANTFYDRNNTAYYLDPASTSNLFNVDIVGDLRIKDNSILFTSPTGINFDASSNLSINTNQFFIEKTTGNVGINTTSPTEKLTVQGDIKGTDGSKTKYILMGGDTVSTGGQLKLYDTSGTLQIWLRTTGKSYINFGKFGVATKSPSQTFQVGKAGDGTSAVANAWNTFSDIRFKKNIKRIENPLDKILSLEGIYFDWKTTGEKSIGFIAQQVQQVLPEIVQADSQGYLSVSYSKLTPVLIEAVKTQQGLIKENILRIDNLELNIFGEIQKLQLDTKDLSQKKIESKLPPKNQNTVLKIFDVKDKIVEIVKSIVFKAQVVFKQQVKFLSNVVFTGRIEYEDKDLAGYARISRGSTEIKISFEKPFSFTPIVTASALNTPVNFFLKDITPSGFTIAINSSADQNYDFSWIAMPVRNARKFTSYEKTPDYLDNPIPSEGNQEKPRPDNLNQNSSSVQKNKSQQQIFPAKDYQNKPPLPTPLTKNNQTVTSSSSQSNEDNNNNQSAFHPVLTVSPAPASDKQKNQSAQSLQTTSIESKTESESSP